MKLSKDERALLKKLEPIVEEFDEFLDSEDSAQAQRELARVKEEYVVAREAAEYFVANATKFPAFVAALGETLADWLEMLPFDLQEHGLFDEALALNAEVGKFGDGPARAIDRAQLYFLNDQLPNAIAEIERVMEKWPDRVEAPLRAAQLYFEAANLPKSKELAKKMLAVKVKPEDKPLHEDAQELLELIAAQEREQEKQKEKEAPKKASAPAEPKKKKKS